MSDQPKSEEELEDLPEEVAALHPSVFFLAANLFEINDHGNQFMALNDEVVEELDGYLKELAEQAGGEELIHMVQSLAAFVQANREPSPAVCEQVAMLIEQKYVVEAITQWKLSADPAMVEELAQQFGDFAGLSNTKTAPGIDDEKPEGAVSINDLDFPKRM